MGMLFSELVEPLPDRFYFKSSFLSFCIWKEFFLVLPEIFYLFLDFNFIHMVYFFNIVEDFFFKNQERRLQQVILPKI